MLGGHVTDPSRTCVGANGGMEDPNPKTAARRQGDGPPAETVVGNLICPLFRRPSPALGKPALPAMEVSLEDRLPEADSLPDGFVESSAEPQLSSFSSAPPPPLIAEYKDSLLDPDCGPVRRSPDLLFDELSVVDRLESAVRVVASPCLPENDDNVGASSGSAEVRAGTLLGSVPGPRTQQDHSSLRGGEQVVGDDDISNRGNNERDCPPKYTTSNSLDFF